jgi:hypothetical protein
LHFPAATKERFVTLDSLANLFDLREANGEIDCIIEKRGRSPRKSPIG